MNRDEKAKHIGEMLADGLGPGPVEHSVEICRQAVFSAMENAQSRGRRYFGYSAAAAAVIVIASGIAVYDAVVPSPVEYRVGDRLIVGDGAQWVRNEAAAALPIVFENGSRFDLDNAAVAKVVESDSRRVRIDLNHGRVSAKVNGNGHTQWIVEAGPYRVKVLGTQFSVSWNAAVARLFVSVSAGHVSVSGADMGPGGVVLAAGQSLASSAAGTQIHTTADGQPPPMDEALITTAGLEVEKTGDSPATGDAASFDEPVMDNRLDPAPRFSSADKSPGRRAAYRDEVPSTAVTPVPAWKTCILASDWEGALSKLDADGVAWVSADAELNVLWQLADEARRARRGDVADRFFVAVRSRFSGTGRAARAAFLLGKSAVDMRADYADAARWFEVYLTEAPQGSLLEEALARLMEAYIALGRSAAAKRIASRYLQQYPQGTFAKKAAGINHANQP